MNSTTIQVKLLGEKYTGDYIFFQVVMRRSHIFQEKLLEVELESVEHSPSTKAHPCLILIRCANENKNAPFHNNEEGKLGGGIRDPLCGSVPTQSILCEKVPLNITFACFVLVFLMIIIMLK